MSAEFLQNFAGVTFFFAVRYLTCTRPVLQRSSGSFFGAWQVGVEGEVGGLSEGPLINQHYKVLSRLDTAAFRADGIPRPRGGSSGEVPNF